LFFQIDAESTHRSPDRLHCRFPDSADHGQVLNHHSPGILRTDYQREREDSENPIKTNNPAKLCFDGKELCHAAGNSWAVLFW
jgi:hypothetical protein